MKKKKISKKIAPAKNKIKKTANNKVLTGKKSLIVANWKMTPESLKEARKTFSILQKSKIKIKDEVVICPPVIYLSDLVNRSRSFRFTFGAQDVSFRHHHESTGEISLEMLNDLKVKHVIVGHSERRDLGETNRIVAEKINLITSKNTKAILCVGERTRDINGEYLRFIERQIIESLEGFNHKFIKNLIIAYEPVWAIGKGHEAVTAYDLHQMTLYIKKVLVGIFGHKIGMNVPIIYGGSVDEENAKALLDSGEIQGLLVGRASLNAYTFINILKNLS